MSTIVLACSCYQKYQNQIYGHGRRLHNILERSAGMARCTGCGKERSISTGEEKPKKKEVQG